MKNLWRKKEAFYRANGKLIHPERKSAAGWKCFPKGIDKLKIVAFWLSMNIKKRNSSGSHEIFNERLHCHLFCMVAPCLMHEECLERFVVSVEYTLMSFQAFKKGSFKFIFKNTIILKYQTSKASDLLTNGIEVSSWLPHPRSSKSIKLCFRLFPLELF